MENYAMNNSGIEIFKTEDGKTQVQVVLENETVWLNLNQISELFHRDKSVISRHIGNIFKEEELAKSSVVANFATTAKDGKLYQVEYFNLDVIISVGYRVKSKRGTQFRIWANKIIKEYLGKGYSLKRENVNSAKRAIKREKYYGNSDLFGNEKDESFKSSQATVYQTFDGVDLYPSVMAHSERKQNQQKYFDFAN